MLWLGLNVICSPSTAVIAQTLSLTLWWYQAWYLLSPKDHPKSETHQGQISINFSNKTLEGSKGNLWFSQRIARHLWKDAQDGEGVT